MSSALQEGIGLLRAAGWPRRRRLNRKDSDWRWLAGRDDSPWRPSLRLFRQAGPGAWEAVVAQVRFALAAAAA